MTAIAPQSASPTGISVTFTAAANGDTVQNNRGRSCGVVKNGSGGSINVTIPAVTTARPAEGNFPAMTVADLVVPVAAGATAVIGPIPAAYNNANGQFTMNYSATATITVGGIEVL
jgi:hypothetical protein